MTFDSMSTRMKQYEASASYLLPRRSYTLMRLDGKAFHTYTKGLQKPFDYQLMSDMDATAAALCKEISGALFAYVQSDEISILLSDFKSLQSEPWLAGKVQKLTSVSASIATAHLNSLRHNKTSSSLAFFDSRVFSLADPTEVANYFIWRQKDCVRNSISMLAQSQFSHKELHGLSSNQLQEKLWSEKDINWNDLNPTAKRGRVVLKETKEEEITFTHKKTNIIETVTALRSKWLASTAPDFLKSEWLGQHIPKIG